jgi:hypothetical protein
MTDAMNQDPRNQRSEENDPSRRMERERVGVDIAARLSERGVDLTGDESSEELVTLLETLERFERAVQAKGGDLMVDEGPSATKLQPDDVQFVIPTRSADESVSRYIRRIEEATGSVEQHPPIGG